MKLIQRCDVSRYCTLCKYHQDFLAVFYNKKHIFGENKQNRPLKNRMFEG